MRRALVPVCVLTGALLASPSSAQSWPWPTPTGDPLQVMFDSIVLSVNAWIYAVLPFVRNLFVSLATLDLVWLCYDGIFRQGDGMGELAARLFKRVVVLAIFSGIILLASGFYTGLPAGTFLVAGFADAGQTASGLSEISATGFFVKSAQFISAYTAALSKLIWIPGGSLAGVGITIIYAGMLLAMLSISAIIALTIIEVHFKVSLGFVLLAFTGSRFTIRMAEPYPVALVRVGVKLLCMYAFLGIGNRMLDQWTTMLADVGFFGFGLFFGITAAALIYAIALWRAPVMVADLLPSNGIDFAFLFEPNR